MIVSGLRAHHLTEREPSGPRIPDRRRQGRVVIPGLQTVRRLSLDLHEAELSLRCVTHQGIPIGVRAVVIYKIADDYQSIANAARRFLDQHDQHRAGGHGENPADTRWKTADVQNGCNY